ncbi:hypothetical protein FF098_010895 [Parvularcula flava]|uniref:Uncharacterized protein n=1 Tax=Aquisalinus luteolus TaxID=1566827 RepID=A0A8J3A303_9PROT|nr:hypothetical protein [Aquisalinus luteolus]NHK28413.1 hypothetical protein [Aquisalinus luteolus]GGH98399.1 hypothetical protein GCM10011355_21900 [Aquisalinus luteolus]
MARPWHKTEPKGEYGPGLRAAFAYLVACYFTAFCLSLQFVLGWSRDGQETFISKVGGSFIFSLPVFGVVVVLTFIPVAVFVSLARHFRWLRGVSDSIAGGVIGLMLSILFMKSALQDMAIGAVLIVAIYTVTGTLSGLIYWLLAGRPAAPTRPVASHETDL